MKSASILKLTTIFVIGIGLAVPSLSFSQVIAHPNVASLTVSLVTDPVQQHIQRNFGSIQEAINQAENNSTIHIPSGIYYERIIVNKTISLVGEKASTTIIDGNNGGTIVKITANNVTFKDFTVQNTGWGWLRNGIYVYFADNCKIRGNFLFHNCQNIRLNHSRNSQVSGNIINGDGYGIRFINSFNCRATSNNVSNCIGGVHLQNATSCTVRMNYFTQNSQGIRLYSPCANNNITVNTVYNNTYEGMIETMPPNATFFHNFMFHNNFINNTRTFIYKASGNIWDNGYPSGGNYWSRYNGTDLHSGLYQNETGSDGIGDEPHNLTSLEVDRYPLMRPYGSVRNLNASLACLTIQSAIDASETLDGHILSVDSGVYHEHLNVHKSLMLIGENETTTIIDGGNVGTVLSVNADNVSVARFTVRNSGLNSPPYGNDCGVFLDYSDGSNITHCLVMNNRIGIYLFHSKENVIEHNLVYSNNENGVLLYYSGNNTLRENEILDNSHNFGVFGGSSTHFINTIDTSNTVDSKPIQYLTDVTNQVFDHHANIGVLYLINSINITVRDLTLTKNGHSVFFYNVTGSTIENVTASNNGYGIYLQDSRENIIESNYCFENWVGICLQDSEYNVAEGNIAENCEKGFSLYEADNNNLRGNTVSHNLYGIRLYSSHFNEFFHNNLIENTNQADLITSQPNVWDNGCEGNYWSSYNGTDLNGDGIGDTDLPWEGLDHYPLANSYWNSADINHDLKVNIYDIVRICVAYGSSPSDTRWNPHCDIAETYGIIDMNDIDEACLDYGKEWDNP